MTVIETNETETSNAEADTDHIEVIHHGQCPSLSSRSMLAYVIGRKTQDNSLHLAIVGNSGGGMWCKDWCSASDIQDVVLGEGALIAKSFHSLHPGKSINTGGFVLAALKDIGLIRVNQDNTRLHEHVPAATFEKAVTVHVAQTKEVKQEEGGRKSLRRKSKED